ncbi:MAG TPA: hypothetical protein VGI90_14440 [Steroidobacteraceae bacterium]|jgi:hypothetical protein
MARNEKPGGKGKIKFRFIDFEMDGSDSTLQDAIKQITQAIGRPTAIKVQTASLTGPSKGGAEEVLDAEGDTTEEETQDTELEDDDDDQTTSADRASKPRRFKSPKVVQVDLRGQNPLRPFLERIAPDSDAKRYMAIAYWFKTFRDAPEIGPDHIYTAYKEMSWSNIPKDVGAPLRALKSDGSFEKGAGKQAYILNHIGEGKVEDMIKKAPPAQ